MMVVNCTNCRRPYPEQGVPYRCPTCGGIYDFSEPLPFQRTAVDDTQPGIWRYRHTFGISKEVDAVSLGEGNTPLLWVEFQGSKVALKCEYLNPTGSFKDRGSATLVGFLRSRQVSQAVEDSSGNAGASFAAYAARAGVRAQIFIPESTAGPKRAQIEAYGAQVSPVSGPRSNATESVLKAAEAGQVYASHAYLPFNLPGYATLAYELVEQIGDEPGSVILPVGQGGLMLGLLRGFEALRNVKAITRIPQVVGVQARNCAPLWAAFNYGVAGLQWVSEGPTLAEGIRVRYPVRGDTLIKTVEATSGQLVAIDEEDILVGRDQLAHLGFYVEMTSAVVWKAMEMVANQVPEPIVLILTGSGFKNASD